MKKQCKLEFGSFTIREGDEEGFITISKDNSVPFKLYAMDFIEALHDANICLQCPDNVIKSEWIGEDGMYYNICRNYSGNISIYIRNAKDDADFNIIMYSSNHIQTFRSLVRHTFEACFKAFDPFYD